MTGIPTTWRLRRLSDIAQNGLFKDGDWVESKDQDPAGTVRLTQLADVGVGVFRDRSDRWLREDQAIKLGCTFLAADDVLIARMPDPIGRACLVPAGLQRAVTVVDVAILRPDSSVVDPRFLMWALNEPSFHKRVVALQSGTTRKRISRKNLASLKIAVPSLPEQLRIIEVLEDHLSRLDAGRGLLQSAKQRALALRARHLASMAPDDAPRVTLGELAESAGYGTSTKCVTDGSGVPVVRIPNLQHGRVNLNPEKRAADPGVDLSQLMLKQNDLLIVRTNGSKDLIGRAAVVQSGVTASFASYLIRYKLDEKVVRPEWVRSILNTPQLRTVLERMAASSAGQYNLGLSKLNSLSLPCPSLDVQDRLLRQHEDRDWQHETLTRRLNAADLRAQSLRQALLVAAFSGRLSGRSSAANISEEMAGV